MKKKIGIMLCILIFVVLIGILSFIVIYRKTHSVLPKEINSIAIRYAPGYNIETAEALNKNTEGGYIDFQTVELSSYDNYEILKYLKNIHEDSKRFNETDCLLGGYSSQIILNNNYIINIGNCWSEAGYIDSDKEDIVYIPNELEKLVDDIIEKNNNEIFTDITGENINIEIKDNNIKVPSINKLQFLKINIDKNYLEYDDIAYIINFDNAYKLYAYGKVGYLFDLINNEEYYVLIREKYN